MSRVYCLPTAHPAFALRGQLQYLRLIATDLERAMRLAEVGWVPNDDLILCLPGNEGVFWRAYDTLTAWHKSKVAVAVDVETTGKDRAEAIDAHRCKLRMYAISALGTNVSVGIPLNGVLPPEWESAFVALAKAICGDEEQPKIFHNFAFDVTVLNRHGHIVRGPLIDTVIRAHVVAPDIKHDLGSTAHTYLDTRAWKDDFRRLGKHATTADWQRYNALDSLRTQQLVGPLDKLLEERQLWPAVHAQTAWACVAWKMEQNGLPLHEPTRKKYEDRVRAAHDRAIEDMRQLCGRPDFTPSKPSHATWYLYEFIKAPVRKWTKKKHDPSTSYKGLIDFTLDPRIQAYIRWSEAKGDLSTFLVGFKKKVHEDGRLRPSWNPTGQVGTRFSSSPNCCDEETEVLTAEGWIPIEVAKGTPRLEIAAWNGETREITFETPERWVSQQYNGPLVTFENQHVDIAVTPDHRLLYYTGPARNQRLRETTADQFPRAASIPTSGHYNAGSLSIPPAVITVLCATQADGWWNPRGGYDFSFVKQREAERLAAALRTLHEAGLTDFSNYRWRSPSGRGPNRYMLRISSRTSFAKRLRAIIGPTKTFPMWLLQMDAPTAKFFLEELRYWDGRSDTSRTNEYASTNKDNAEFVQTLAALHGMRAVQREFWGSRSKKPCYVVSYVPRLTSGRSWKNDPKTVQYNGMVY